MYSSTKNEYEPLITSQKPTPREDKEEELPKTYTINDSDENNISTLNNKYFLKYLKYFGVVALLFSLFLISARLYHSSKHSSKVNHNNSQLNMHTTISNNEIHNHFDALNKDSQDKKHLEEFMNNHKQTHNKHSIHNHEPNDKQINKQTKFGVKNSMDYSNDALNDLITDLPGYSNDISDIAFNQFSGFLEIEGTTRELFYWFMESENDPENDPLIIWLNGGPGCSSLVGLLTENGGFWIEEDGKLKENEYSWNKVANILWVEQPTGVGFSKDTSDESNYITGDTNAAKDLDSAIRSFLKKFALYQDHTVYLSGESYAGHYLPMTAKTILENNDDNLTPQINFGGFLVGNPYTDPYERSIGLMSALYGHGLMKSDVFEDWMSNCYGKSSSKISSNECETIYVQGFYQVVFDNINFYALDYDDCSEFSINSNEDLSVCENNNDNSNNKLNELSDNEFVLFDSRYGYRTHLPALLEKYWYDKINKIIEDDKNKYKIDHQFKEKLVIERDFLHKYGTVTKLNNNNDDKIRDNSLNSAQESTSMYVTCSAEYAYCYLNKYEVQKALNVLSSDSTIDDRIDWDVCNLDVNTNWPDSDFNGVYIESVYKTLIEDYDIKILIYSGDNDAVCATEGTLYWMNNKMDGYEVDSNNDFIGWSLEDDDTQQVAGYYSKYISSSDSSTAWHFTTVRSAGHMVPSTQPKRSLEVLKKFLNDWN